MVARWERPPPHKHSNTTTRGPLPNTKSMKKLLHILLIAALFASCHQDEPINPTPEECPIQFGDVQTRAAVENADDIDSFGVWAWINTGSEGEEGENNFIPLLDAEKVTRVTDGWDYVNTRYWVPEGVFRFVGIYPFGAGTITDGKITTDKVTQNSVEYDRLNIAFETPSAADQDLLFASQMERTSTPSDSYSYPSAVDMDFNHALSKVTIKVTPSESNVAAHFKLVSAELKGVVKSGTLSLTSAGSNSWSVGTETLSFSKEYGDGVLLEDGAQDIVATALDGLLIVPQNRRNVTLTIKYKYQDGGDIVESEWEDKEGELTFPTGRWLMGNQYTYTVVLSETNYITIRTVDVDVPSWGEDGSGATIIIK